MDVQPNRATVAAAHVGVFGATGYAGRELVRILAVHPRARASFTTGTGEGHLAHEAGLERKADAYFLSLPHGICRHLRLAAARRTSLRRSHRPLR